MPGRHTFRPGSAIPLSVVSAAVVAYLLGDAVVRGGMAQAVLLAPWPLLALWFVWLAAFASRVTIEDDALTVQNMLRVVRVPWVRVADISWRWQVDVELDDGSRVRAIGGPTQGRSARRPGNPQLTPAHMRAQYDAIVAAWEKARDGAAAASTLVVRGWDRPGLVVLTVLVMWAAVAVLVTGGPS